jgi:pimeloyl-ACP methyl ester carboxylesterase
MGFIIMQIQCAGLTTHYQQLGHRGLKLVLLHGWGCNWEIFSPIITELSKKYQVIIPDLPGFGRSDTPSVINGVAWSSQEYGHWLTDFLTQTVEHQPFVLGGHSFGGKLTALFAAITTETTNVLKSHLKGIVLIDSAGAPDPLNAREQLAYAISGVVPAFLKRAIPAELKRHWLAQVSVGTDYQAASPAQQAVLKRIVREDITANLPQITVPSLLLWGAMDDSTPLHQGETFARLIPHSQLVVLDQSRHYPFIDQPGKFLASLESFLQQIT